MVPQTAGLGGTPLPKRDLHRFVKWPQYVRLQRQKRVLSMRLKVPPIVNQFVTRALEKNTAETCFKLLLKYKPEDKKQKAERLKAEAAAREAGKEVGRTHAHRMVVGLAPCVHASEQSGHAECTWENMPQLGCMRLAPRHTTRWYGPCIEAGDTGACGLNAWHNPLEATMISAFSSCPACAYG